MRSLAGALSLRGAGHKYKVLTHLSARNFSLLRDAQIAFAPGLNVITGESGAGKSLVIDALQFALGKRPNHSFIGGDSGECVVSLVFELAPKKAKAGSLPQSFRVERTFSRNGRGTLTLNGEQVRVSSLREVMAPLVDVSTQFAQQDIFRPAFHREILDAFGEQQFQAGLQAYREGYNKLQLLRQELIVRREAASKGMEERNYLEFLVGELNTANVSAGEKERLSAEQYVLEHAEEILRRSRTASQLLYNGSEEEASAFDLIARARQEMSSLNSAELSESKLGRALELLDLSLEAVSEAKQLISELADVPEHSPAEVERLRRRLDELNALEHKYRVGADEIPTLLERSSARLDVLMTTPEELSELQAQVEHLGNELIAQALTINDCRRAIGLEMAKEGGVFLARLGFMQARFMVEVSEPEEPLP